MWLEVANVTTPETAADDGPDADTSTSPIPPESAARRRSADGSCISRAHLLQSGQSIRAAVSPRSSAPAPARHSSCPTAARYRASAAPSVSSLRQPPPLQRDSSSRPVYHDRRWLFYRAADRILAIRSSQPRSMSVVRNLPHGSQSRLAGRFRSERRLVVLCIAAVAEPAGSAKGVQERFVCCERWKIGKESSVRA